MASFPPILLTMTILMAASSAAPNNQKVGLKIPDACKGKDFCAIKPEGYDEMQDLVKSLLTPMIIAQSMGDRIGETKKEELSPETDWHNCPYRTKTIEPLWAYSYPDSSDPDYIVQHNLLRQPIDIVTCANDKINTTSSQQCFKHVGLMGNFHMKSSCKATTTKRSLLVVDYQTKKLKKKSYDVPCCCSCHIIRSDEPVQV